MYSGTCPLRMIFQENGTCRGFTRAFIQIVLVQFVVNEL
jgi:hypothetical protein